MMNFNEHENEEERVLGRLRQPGDNEEKALRPVTFAEYSGQTKVKTNLKIFIDAAKAQNIKFFEKYKLNLNNNGTIITDNMYFHGLIFKDDKDIESRNLRQLMRKLKKYHNFLKGNKEFNTKFIDIGDGIAITKKN